MPTGRKPGELRGSIASARRVSTLIVPVLVVYKCRPELVCLPVMFLFSSTAFFPLVFDCESKPENTERGFAKPVTLGGPSRPGTGVEMIILIIFGCQK